MRTIEDSLFPIDPCDCYVNLSMRTNLHSFKHSERALPSTICDFIPHQTHGALREGKKLIYM